MKNTILSLVLIALFVVGCDSGSEEILNNNEVRVILFLSPDCPLCQSYSPTITELQSEFPLGFRWLAVFPGKWTIQDSVSHYLAEYHLTFDELIYDKDLVLAGKYKAKVTPSVFVVRDDEILYSGRINDWAIETGRKKLHPTQHDLRNALEAISENRTIEVHNTEPIGCLIE